MFLVCFSHMLGIWLQKYVFRIGGLNLSVGYEIFVQIQDTAHSKGIGRRAVTSIAGIRKI